MKILTLNSYADEGDLTEIDTARFLRVRKIKGDTVLDFEGITRVDDAVIAELLMDIPVESLADRVQAARGDVMIHIERWRAARTPKVDAEQSEIPPQADQDGMTSSLTPNDRYTPTRLVRRVRTQLARYLVSAYPLADPVLIEARKALIESADDGHLIAQEPFVETNGRYRTMEGGFSALGLEPSLSAAYGRLSQRPQDHDPERTVIFPRLYTHQADAIQGYLRDGQDLVVATGTGSGKTECFLLPLIGHLFREAHLRPESFRRRSVRCLILYPMNALVNDQLGRLRLLFGSTAMREEFRALGVRRPLFGMYTGRTPYPGPKRAARDQERVEPILKYYLGLPEALRTQFRKLGRYPAKDLVAFHAAHAIERGVYGSGAKRGQSYVRHHWDERLQTGPDDAELMTRQEMVREPGGMGASPDILVTNYSMLEFMLMRPYERPIFQETSEWLQKDGNELLLVLDEAHMYRGARGAEVAFLLRRLCDRLGIQNRPDKLRVIATSASLGEGREVARQVLDFAADLSGKPPSAFRLVEGKRDIPTPCIPGSPELAERLAAVNLHAVHEAETPALLTTVLAPALSALGASPSGPQDEPSIFRALYERMRGHPVINQLLSLTAGRAVSLSALAAALFPGAPDRLAATEVLLTLGVLARPASEEPGLIPARIHLMLRGLNGLYACMNERCGGRQADPGLPATFGKLFTESRIICDACGSRVFELASCRDCGAPYVLAYVKADRMEGSGDAPPLPSDLDFLWGETQGTVVRLQVLGAPPRNADLSWPVALHRMTGFLDHLGAMPRDEVRTVWLARERASGALLTEFHQCPVCVPPGGRRHARISDLRSRGEQPFTAILEAQFSEQPPQKHDPRLPNRGRKVLVFSDGRQKAARLAPALETSHARDAFRQVLLMSASALEREVGVARLAGLYPATVWTCASRGINVFPANGEDEQPFHHHLRLAAGHPLRDVLTLARMDQMQPAACFAQAIFSELTDRYYSIPALGLGMVQEDPSPLLSLPFRELPALGLSESEFRVLFRAWVRTQLEQNCFLPGGARRTLKDGWDRPTGLDLRRDIDLVPGRFRAYLDRVVRVPAGAPESKWRDTAAAELREWLRGYVRSGAMIQEEDLYYFGYGSLVLRVGVDAPWFACSSCGRVLPEHISGVCPECLGPVLKADPRTLDDHTGYYRDQVRRAFDSRSSEPFGLLAAEHSAQLTGLEEEEAFIKTERYELQFQDVPTRDGDPPIDVLSCTTTMEVGIDIGALSGVALRNVPPHVANYQQRAGRAGRRGRSVASVLTYAHGSSHDSWYYEAPERIIAGTVRPPVVYIENQQILERHVYAWILQVFFHEVLAANPGTYQLLESLGTVDAFLSAGNLWSLSAFEAWARKNSAQLGERLRGWVPRYAWGIREALQTNSTVDGSVERLITRLRAELPVSLLEKHAQLTEMEQETLALLLEEKLLKTLIDRAIVPRYAFPTDVVAFWVSKPHRPGGERLRREFAYQPQRELELALSEYAPGRTLTIDKLRFTSAALYSPHPPTLSQVLARARYYTSCGQCGFVSLKESSISLKMCPVCEAPGLLQQQFIIPQGFAPDINIPPEVDRGGAVAYAGYTGRAELEVQEQVEDWGAEHFDGRLRVRARPDYLVSVNKGLRNQGFWVCPECGRAEPAAGPQFAAARLGGKAMGTHHPHPLQRGATCSGQPAGPFFLGTQFPTDVLLLRMMLQEPVVCQVAPPPGQLTAAGRVAASTAVEAITLAASRILQIDEGELGGNWVPVAGALGGAVDLFLYDTLPGGAGYTRLTQAALVEVLHEAMKLLDHCEGRCPAACYRCVLHYGNRFLHHGLDRHLGAALLGHVLFGSVPVLSEEDASRLTDQVSSVLRLRGVEHRSVSVTGTRTRPLELQWRGRVRWIVFHHALSDPKHALSPVHESAKLAGVDLLALDAFLVQHDLPRTLETICR